MIYLPAHLSVILQTIQVRQARHTKHCWRNKNEYFIWTPTHEHTSISQPVKPYIVCLFACLGFMAYQPL